MKGGEMLDEQTIEELVSGELKGERYRAVLKALDADPKRWRDCALAFLEDQALRAELKQLSKGTIQWNRNDDITESSPPATPQSRLATDSSPQSTGSAGAHSGSNQPKPITHWSSHVLSTAALLIVSFTVGWLGSELLAERQQGVAPVNNSVVTTSEKSNQAPRPGNALVNADQMFVQQPGQFMPLDYEIPQSFRELERQGKVLLESQDGLVRQRLSDGSTVLIPVQEVRVIPATLSF